MNLTGANTITWVIDVTAPEIRNNISGGTKYWETDDNVKKLYNYEIRKTKAAADGTLAAVIETIPLAKDGHIGPGGITNLYDSGNVVYFKIRKDSNNVYFYDSASGIKSYKFVITGPETVSDTKYNATASKNDSDWKPVRNVSINNGGYYEFELPDVSTPNCHLALFLMDNFGNVSEPYYLGNKGDKGYQWWLLDTAPASINVTKTGTNEAPAWITGTLSYVVDVLKGNTDVGAVIRSITAENATIAAVNFYDYDGNRWGNASQPAYDSSTGKFNDNEAWINVSGIKITLNVEQGYTAKTVMLKVNNAEKELFEIPAKPLVADVITVTNEGNALPAQINQNLNNFVLTIGVPAGVTITSVTVQPDDVQLNWDSNSPLNATITASQGDTDKIIKLVVNNVAKDLFTLKAAEQQTGGGGAGGGNINANIRGSGLALLQGLVAASSPDTVERIENFSHFVVQLPMEPEESVEVTKAALVTKTAPVVKTAAPVVKTTAPEVKPAPVVRTAAPVVKTTAAEVKAAPTVKTAPEVKTTPTVKIAPAAKTAKQEVEEVPVTTDSVVEPQAVLSGTVKGVTAAAQEEKSSSKSALIVVMLAILSAAAGAWYLIKGRKQG